MLFPTPDRVLRKIEKLRAELATYNARVRDYEEQHEMFGKMFGPAPALQEWRGAHDEMDLVLSEAGFEVMMKPMAYISIGKQLPELEKALKNFKRVLDETDVLAKSGHDAARAKFGMGNV